MLLSISEDKAKALGSWGHIEGRISAEKVKDAAKVGLSTAAMKTKLFAEHPDARKITLCSTNVMCYMPRD